MREQARYLSSPGVPKIELKSPVRELRKTMSVVNELGKPCSDLNLLRVSIRHR